jgi:hypothetical protein
MIYILFPIFDIIDSWFGAFLTFPIKNLIWGILAGSLAFIIYWISSNQIAISEIKNEMKILRAKMFDSSLEDKSEYNSLAKKNLSLSFKLLGKILLPAVISITPVIIIALWYDMNHSYYVPLDGEKVNVSTYPTLSELDIEPFELTSKDIEGNTFLHLTFNYIELSIYSNNILIYSGTPFKKPIPYITKKNWWNLLLGNPIGYIDDNANFEAIIFDYPEKILFSKLPKIINGWELLFFVGIFISTIPLRLIFKVQ